MNTENSVPKAAARAPWIWLPRLALFILLCLALDRTASAQAPPPEEPGWVLNSWSFSDTNWLSDYVYEPVSFTNLAHVADAGNSSALLVNSTNAAWLQYNVFEDDGTTNLTADRGSVTFWFAPAWSGTNLGGTGPGVWGRFVEAGAYTLDASYGWWSLYCDPEGANIFFSSQTNGEEATYLVAPLGWTNGSWHFVALTYSPTNTSLYLDGWLATNGAPLSWWPGVEVLGHGFRVGSDGSGLAQARGMFDDLTTYDYELDALSVGSIFEMYSIAYYGVIVDVPGLDAISPAPSSPYPVPTLSGITGPGFMQPIGTNTLNCVSSGSVWLTNAASISLTNQTANFTFAIAGGSEGVLYDVFATATLGPPGSTNYQWAWMGQGLHCVAYTITNLPAPSAFFISGTPQDTDADGLTDAYERLVSHSDPSRADTAWDGVSDLYKVLRGMQPDVSMAVPSLGSVAIPVCPIP